MEKPGIEEVRGTWELLAADPVALATRLIELLGNAEDEMVRVHVARAGADKGGSGVSRGPGKRQRALLAALDAHPAGAVRVVPPNVSEAEASVWRRAAKHLAESGRARAIYISALSKDRRMMPHLVLTRPDSTIHGDAYPLDAPRWVEPPPLTMKSCSTRIQAALLGTSQATAYRLARNVREQAAA
nr:hypothetical protein [Propionicimonas sp.]